MLAFKSARPSLKRFIIAINAYRPYFTINKTEEKEYECKLYKSLSKDKKLVQCHCCSKRCVIENGQCGFCNVRYNRDGKLYLATYGYPCAIQIDPVEKKPLYHFLPGTPIFSIGTQGCNYQCSFCQNWSISQAVNDHTINSNKIDNLLSTIHSQCSYISPDEVIHYAKKNNCKSIAFTYNEPTIWGEYACDIAKLAKQSGMKCVYVTNGSMTEEHLNYIKPYVDALNIDLKAWNPSFYRTLCKSDVESVKTTIQKAWNLHFWIEVTTLIIPGKNDSEDELRHIAHFLASISVDIPWHITAFHPDYKMQNNVCTPLTTLQKAYEIGKQEGIHHIYMGNIQSPGCEDTYCPSCGKKLIKRSWRNIQFVNCTDFNGTCWNCKSRIKGVWSCKTNCC